MVESKAGSKSDASPPVKNKRGLKAEGPASRSAITWMPPATAQKMPASMAATVEVPGKGGAG
jgi:hypothetical protein